MTDIGILKAVIAQWLNRRTLDQAVFAKTAPNVRKIIYVIFKINKYSPNV